MDAENCFFLNGYYRISENVKQYQPKQTDLGTLYDMDHIVCVISRDGTTHFYDMNMDKIPDEDIIWLGDKR